MVKQKRLAKNAPVPCVVRDTATEILAEEDSLAESIQRAPLHPLDQFRAFLSLRAKELSDEEIAAAFFASVTVVKQRLRFASVSSTSPPAPTTPARSRSGRPFPPPGRRSPGRSAAC
jgi:ParB family chromosome partitioning protein